MLRSAVHRRAGTRAARRSGHRVFPALPLFALMLPGCTPGEPQPLDSETGAVEEILTLERRGLDRWSSGDPLGYAETASEDVTYFDDIKASTRIEGLEAWRSYLASLEVPPHDYEIVDPRVQLYGDTGILTLHYVASGPDGTPLARWKATSVYRRVAGEWRLVHAHWSTSGGP